MSQTKAQLISDLVQALNFTGTSSAPANGMYLSAANTIKLATNSNGRLTIDSSGNATFTGTCTATTFIGALTGTASGNAVLTGSTNNQLVTVTGANAITGESTLLWSGSALSAYRDNATTYGPSIVAHHQRGTIASPSVSQTNDTLLTIVAKGYDGDEYHDAARIDFISGAGTPGNNDMPGSIVFKTTDDGTATSVARLTIAQSGVIKVEDSSTLLIPDAIQHTGDTNTQIRFPAADTFAVETAGAEDMRVAGGIVGIGTEKTVGQGAKLRVGVPFLTNTQDMSDGGIIIVPTTGATITTGQVMPGIIFAGEGSSPGIARAGIGAVSTNGRSAMDLLFLTRSAADGTTLDVTDDEKLRITSGGDVRLNGGALIGDNSALPTFTIANTDGNANNVKISLGESVGSDNGGITFYTAGASSSTARMRIRGNNNFIDILSSYVLRFNDGALTISHAGDHGYITAATGILHLRSDSSIRLQDEGGSPMLYGYDGGAVELYNNGTKQCETSTNGLAFPSGKGIDFNATSDYSGATSEIFEDYEEGIFTPNIKGTSGAGTASYSTRSGKYTKVGNFVHITFEINWSSGSAGGELRVTDLPFSPTTDYEGIGSCMFHSVYLHGNEGLCVYVGPGVNYTYFYQSRSNDSWHSVNYDSAGVVIGNVSYRTS